MTTPSLQHKGYSLGEAFFTDSPLKNMFGQAIKKTLPFKSCKVRITHLPGELRFPNGNRLAAAYGYIMKHKSPYDKASLDVYVSPQLLTGSVGKTPIFIIDQIVPETGELDEHKIMLGFDDIDTAKNVYLHSVPNYRFGNIRTMTVNDLLNYGVE